MKHDENAIESVASSFDIRNEKKRKRKKRRKKKKVEQSEEIQKGETTGSQK